MVLCYLMKSKNWSPYCSYDYLKQKRPNISNLKIFNETMPQWVTIKKYHNGFIK